MTRTPVSTLRRPSAWLAPLILAATGTASGAATAATPDAQPIDQPAVKDPCMMAVEAGAPEAERTCSDLIAGLRYDGVAGGGAAALAGALNNRAMARMRTGDLEGAGADFTEALELLPDAWALYLNRATLALRRGDAGSALNDVGRVRELVPAGAPAARAADRSAALAWRMLGNLDAARMQLEQMAVSAAPEAGAVPVPPPG